MKKSILFFGLFAVLSFPVFSQFNMGVKVGGNLSNIHINMNSVELGIYEPRIGFHGGLMFDYMFTDKFGLQTELMYVNSGATINPTMYLKGADMPSGVSLKGHLSMNTIQVPLSLKTKISISNTGISLYGMLGGFASYSPATNQQVTIYNSEETIKLKWSIFDEMIHLPNNTEYNVYMQQRFNVGITLEAGIDIANRTTIGAGFRQVLNNMAAFGYTVNGITFKPTTKMWTANLSIGYYF